MSQALTIDAVVAELLLTVAGSERLAVGLVLSDGRVAWGDCRVDVDPLGHSPLFEPERGRESVLQNVAPALSGRPLSRFRDLAAAVDAVTERVTVTETIPQPQPDIHQTRQAANISRRRFITGLTAADPAPEAQPQTRQVAVDRPLHPAIRYACSQALLSAVALARNTSPAHVIADEYGLRLQAQAVPLAARVQDVTHPAVLNVLAALTYTLKQPNSAAQLGENCRHLQRYVRDLQTWMSQTAGAGRYLTLCLNTQGGIGTVYADDVGKTLGTLFGLEKAAQPHRLCAIDPLIRADREAQIATLYKLKDYLRLRRMELLLAAEAWIYTADDARTFAESGAVHRVRLVPARLGGWAAVLEAIQACDEAGVEVILAPGPAETEQSARLSVQVALATRPALLEAPPGTAGIVLAHNEMEKHAAIFR